MKTPYFNSWERYEMRACKTLRGEKLNLKFAMLKLWQVLKRRWYEVTGN